MAGIARAMKRHGLTAKPALRLVNTVRSGDVDYYMFDLSDSGRHYTIAKHEFWRGGGTSPCIPQADLGPALAAVSAAVSAAAEATPAPPSPAEPEPTPEPATLERVEYVRVREMQQGDVVSVINAPKGRPREVVRVVKGTPTYTLHYVWEGQAALRTSQHLPGARFILRKRNERS